MNAFLFYHDHRNYLDKIFGRPPRCRELQLPAHVFVGLRTSFWLAGNDVPDFLMTAAENVEGGSFYDSGRSLSDRFTVIRKRKEVRRRRRGRRS